MNIVEFADDRPHYLVTGGAGFIGSHLVGHLLQLGAQVTVVDDLSSGYESNLPVHPRLRLIKKDLADLALTDVPQYPDALAHLAAIPSVADSWNEPTRSHEVNLSNTLKLIELAVQWKCRRIVFASSAAVYGDLCSVPIDESSPTRPISPYGLHKLCSEEYLRLFAHKYGLECVALRLFNVYGARQRHDSGYSGVISKFIHAVAIGQNITINGDGKQTRDFVAVEDVADAFALALRLPVGLGMIVRCNVGSGQGVSIEAVAKHLIRAACAGSSILYDGARHGDIRHSCADIGLLESWLGYRPQRSWRDGFSTLLGQERLRSGAFSTAEKLVASPINVSS